MQKTLLSSLFVLMALVAALFLACDDDEPPVGSGSPRANVRVIHASFDAPDVDIRVDGAVAVAGLGYGATSGYAQVDPGARNVTVTPSGATTPVVLDLDVNVTVDKFYTVVALDEMSTIDAVFQEDLRSSNPSKAKVRFIHAAPDAPAVDIKVNSGTGATVFSNRAFKSVSDYIEVDAGAYTFAVTATGSTAEEALYKPIGLQNGKVYTIVALGTLDKTDAYPFRVRVFTDNDDGAAFADLLDADLPDATVRVLHTSYDGGPVDVLVDDAVAFASLTYGEAAAYSVVTAGTRNIKVTPAGVSSTVLVETDDEFRSGNEYTLVAVDEAADLDLLIGGDNRTPNPDQAKVRFIHASPDAPRVDVRLNSGFGPKQFPNVAFRTIGAYSSVDAGDYVFVLTMADSTWELIAYEPIALANGQVYTLVALGTLDDGDAYPFTLRLFSDNDDGTSYTDLTVEPRTKADFRVMHLSYDAPAVNVLVDGYAAIPSLAFKGSSKYTELNAGTRNIQVQSAAGGPSVIDADLDFVAGAEYTIFAVDRLTTIAALFEEDDRAPVADQAKVRFVHAVHDAPAVDIKLETGTGAAVFSNLSFKDITDYQIIDDTQYRFVVTAAGDTNEVLVFNPVALSPNTTYTIVAHGTFSLTDTVQFGVRVYTDNGNGNQFVDLTIAKSPVRLIHASYDGPVLDVLSDGVRQIQAVPYRGTAGYAQLNAGTRNIQVVPANQTSPVLIEETRLLDEDVYYTAFAFDELASIEGVFVVDDRVLSGTQAKVRFVHAAPDAGPVDIKVNSGSGAAVFAAANYKDISSYVSVDPGAYVFAVTAAGNTDEIVVFDPFALQTNSLYTIVAFGTLDTLDQYPFGVRVFRDNGDGNIVNDLTINEPSIRVIHASYDAPAVEVRVDDVLKWDDTIQYAGTKGYSEVDPGVRNIKVGPVGGAAVIDIDLNLAFNTDYTIFAMDQLALIDPVYDIDDRTPNPSAPKARFVHASPDAPAVDVKTVSGTGATLFGNVSFKGITPYQTLSAGATQLVITPAGSSSEVRVYLPFTFANNTVYTIMAFGTLADGDGYPFRVRIFTDNGAGTGSSELTIAASKLRVIHAGVDGYPIETLVGDSIKHTNVAYEGAGGYLDVGPGNRNIKVRQSGFATPPVIDTTVELGFRTDYTLLVLDSLSRMSAVVASDARATITDSVKLRFTHAVLDMPAVDIRRDNPTGTLLFGDYAFGEVSPYLVVSNGSYVFSVVEAGTTNEVARFDATTLNTSSSYTLIALGTANQADASPFTVRLFTDNGPGNQSTALTAKTGKVRAIHLSQDSPAVDFTLDGVSQATNIDFRTPTAYVNATPGTRALALLETGTANVVVDTSVIAAPDASYTLWAFDSTGTAVAGRISTDDRAVVTNPKVRFVNAVSDAPALTLQNFTFGFPLPMNSNVSFKTVSTYTSTLTASPTFVFQVADAGTLAVVVLFQPVNITGSTVYTMVLTGTLDTGDAYPLQGRLYIDNGTGSQVVDLVPTVKSGE
ncbi:MAG: DUF4397 domain-containing protein [candidate division Zixibacteria bacterium]|jgi:hypothetical protein|nr:DUF4397 domain-containing protein [candidate division Zixibacteria bacterium]